MKYPAIIFCALVLTASTFGCHKKSDAPRKTTGLDGYRNWHRYTVADRTITITGGSPVTTHDTLSMSDLSFALMVVDNFRVFYHDSFADLNGGSDTVSSFKSAAALSATDSALINIYYYHETDQIVAEYITIHNYSDTDKTEHSTSFERTSTY